MSHGFHMGRDEFLNAINANASAAMALDMLSTCILIRAAFVWPPWPSLVAEPRARCWRSLPGRQRADADSNAHLIEETSRPAKRARAPR